MVVHRRAGVEGKLVVGVVSEACYYVLAIDDLFARVAIVGVEIIIVHLEGPSVRDSLLFRLCT